MELYTKFHVRIDGVMLYHSSNANSYSFDESTIRNIKREDENKNETSDKISGYLWNFIRGKAYNICYEIGKILLKYRVIITILK